VRKISPPPDFFFFIETLFNTKKIITLAKIYLDIGHTLPYCRVALHTSCYFPGSCGVAVVLSLLSRVVYSTTR
jgi:hypothetical protein